jgi:hypothetical protein
MDVLRFEDSSIYTCSVSLSFEISNLGVQPTDTSEGECFINLSCSPDKVCAVPR